MSDETVSAVQRKAEATGDPVDEERALVQKARGGDEEAQAELKARALEKWTAARAGKPVSEMTPYDVANTPNPYGSTEGTRERYYALQEAKELLEDELAEARAMARRGEPPRPSWKPNVIGPRLDSLGNEVGLETGPDPRMTAWREAAWKRFLLSARALGAWGFPDKAPDLDAILKLEKSLESAHKAVAHLRGQFEQDRGM